ncbi:MAG: AAA family ATPase [Candidatus Methanoperedens sp.]
MKIEFVEILNFRKLKSCRVDFNEKETVFVGANNSGKTSAMDALILFLKDKTKFSTSDFTISNRRGINEIGKSWINESKDNPADLSLEKWQEYLPHLDVWIKVEENEIYYVSHIIPTLQWQSGLLGIRLRLEPENIEILFNHFHTLYKSSKEAIEKAKNPTKNEQFSLKLWPATMWDFLEKKLPGYFKIHAYILDPLKLKEPEGGHARPQIILSGSTPLDSDPFKDLIKIDIINAQRGFSGPNTPDNNIGNLSSQLGDYFKKHLNPSDQPNPSDIEALQSIEDAKISFDAKLKESFQSSLMELESLNYPGFGNPRITISSLINPIDGLDHPSAVQFDVSNKDDVSLDSPLRLPEKYNGLGYQNLISMVFKLIRFRDEWMQVGKISKIENRVFEPLHLVLIEEPEAHLHAQIQQVFIGKAYEVLRNHINLKKSKQFSTQLVVSTHSNHIAHEVDFVCLRYFRRKPAIKNGDVPTSIVVNLSKTFGTENDTTKFAIRYLKTTHCDLFFADAAILVEGPAERMLVPHFIRHNCPELAISYISLLEIGGSHAHRLRPLIEDLGLITLVITDIDSIDSNGKTAVLPEKNKGYKTGNDTLKSWLPVKENLDELLALNDESKESKDFPIRVAYQFPLNIKFQENEYEAIPYTFEDALAFENIALFKTIEGNGLIKKISNAIKMNTKSAGKDMFDALKNGKKAEFALELLFLKEPETLKVPKYIKDGLDWMNGKLKIKQEDFIAK